MLGSQAEHPSAPPRGLHQPIFPAELTVEPRLRDANHLAELVERDGAKALSPEVVHGLGNHRVAVARPGALGRIELRIAVIPLESPSQGEPRAIA